jgi:DNA-binding PadR family transcriptional regulator
MEILTKQEEWFLLAVFHIGEGAYLVNIREFLLEHGGKDWAFGSIYTTLEKLCRKGHVRTRSGDPGSFRGGKAIKYYALTRRGLLALEENKRLHDRMWRDFAACSSGGKG